MLYLKQKITASDFSFSISFFCVGLLYITIQNHLSYRGASSRVYSKSDSWCIPNQTAGPSETRSSSGKPAGRNPLSAPRCSTRSTASTTECKTGPRPPGLSFGARFRVPIPSRPKSHFGFLYSRVKTLAIISAAITMMRRLTTRYVISTSLQASRAPSESSEAYLAFGCSFMLS